MNLSKLRNGPALRLYSLIVGIALIMSGGFVVYKEAGVADWIQTEATIVSVTRASERQPDGDYKEVYHYTLQYVVEGREYATQGSSSTAVRKDETKQLLYNPTSPNEARIGGRNGGMGWTLLGIGVGLIALRAILVLRKPHHTD